jgi:hypothetical protein
MSLPADSAISTLIDASTAVTVVETTITQYTAEPIRFAPQLESLDVQYSKRVFSGYVPVGTMEINSDFAGGSPVAPTITSSSGDLTNYATHMYLVAPDGSLMNADITGTYTIPGRAANQAPVAYTVRIQLGAVSELRPSASYAWGEFSTGSFTYTGDQVSDTIYGDCTTAIRCTRLECTCQAQVYKRIVALDAAHLDFAPMNVQLKTSPNENVALAAPSYAPSLSTGPMTWDAGDDDLGGY